MRSKIDQKSKPQIGSRTEGTESTEDSFSRIVAFSTVSTRSKVDEAADSLIQSARPQQRLNFRPLPQGHESFRPGATDARIGSRFLL